MFEPTVPAGLKQHKIYDDLCCPYKLSPSKKRGTDSTFGVASRQRKFFRMFEPTAPAGLKQHKIYDNLYATL